MVRSFAGRGIVSRRRWSAIVGLTACGIAAVLIILLNPTWLERTRPPGGKPLLSVLVDASASMDTPDAGSATTRYRGRRNSWPASWPAR